MKTTDRIICVRMWTLCAVVVVAGAAAAQCPTPGSLCDGVAAPSTGDFWAQWDAADWVVFGMPWQPDNCLDPDPGQVWLVSSTTGPVVGTCSFTLLVGEVWKGPATVESFPVSTSWLFDDPWSTGPLPGEIQYAAEECALAIGDGSPLVFFLRLNGGTWETYRCYGTGTYDRDWIVAEVGMPVPIDACSWGSLKARYR